MKRLALFASGSGTNVENIVKYFNSNKYAYCPCVFTNNVNAYVIERCITLDLKCRIFDRQEFVENDSILEELKTLNPDLIILAGFLWLIPSKIVKAFPGKIINIHPALLPKFGGKGMYGMRVHEAVVLQKEKETGITIHWVDEKYDEGSIIFQAKCDVSPTDTPELVAQKIHQLEHIHYPQVIESILKGMNT